MQENTEKEVIIIIKMDKKQYNKEYHKKNRDKRLKEFKLRYLKKREEELLRIKKWRKANPKKVSDNKKKNYNPLKKYARNQAFNKTTLSISTICAKCGEIATERHHEDYNKPLEVIFLCKSCHNIITNKSGGRLKSCCV